MKKLATIASMLTLFAGINLAQASANISTQASNLKVHDVKVQKPKKGDTEVKMKIKNNGNNIVDIIAAYSPVDTKTQLHHFVTNSAGERIMKQIDSIEIYPHNEVALSFQEVHIMLMGLKHKLKEGSTVTLRLIMKDGSTIPVKAKVN